MGTKPETNRDLISRLHLRRARTDRNLTSARKPDLESRLTNADSEIQPNEEYSSLIGGIGKRPEEIVYETGANDKEGGLPCREITEFIDIVEKEKSYRTKKNKGNSRWDKLLFGIEVGSTTFIRTGFSPMLLYDMLFAGYCLRTAAKNYITEHTIDKIAPYFFIFGSVVAPAAYYMGMRMTNKKLETQDFVYMGIEFALSWGKAALDYSRRIVENDISKATYRQKKSLTSSFKGTCK